MANTDVASEEEQPPTHLREWRLYRQMTQNEVQQRAGWADGRVSKLESGAVPCKPATLRALSRVYACEIGDLFKPPPAPEGVDGMFGVLEMRRLISRLQRDIAELKKAVMPRIEALEGQIAEAGIISEKVIANAEELADVFRYHAAKMPPRPPRK